MTELIAAAAFFVGTHLLVSGTALRALLIARIGERPYLAVYSVVAAVGIVWLASAYGRAPPIDLWGQRQALKPLAIVLVALAFLFAVIGLTTRNPTAVAAEKLLERDDAVTGILRVSRHPFLWGVALWAIAHLAVNGDAASLVLFGALLVLALAGTASIDAKRRAAFGERWARFASMTSNVPFVAIIQGRNSLRIGEIGWWRIVVALLVFAAILHYHRAMFGVSPLPG